MDKKIIFKYAGGEFDLSRRTVVMGILNVTPDSFSDGGRYIQPENAFSQAINMINSGAGIIDVGAQSTKPGCVKISAEEEWARLEPVLRRLVSETYAVISVDTFYPEVAHRALACGAHIINDVSGRPSIGMLSAVKEFGAGYILMHSGNGAASDECSFDDVRTFLVDKKAQLVRAGIAPQSICLDPGIGFGNSREVDREIVRRLGEIVSVCGESAVLIGASRKRVTATRSDDNAAGRMPATIAINTAAQMNGARIIRVHDVREGVLAARMMDKILFY